MKSLRCWPCANTFAAPPSLSSATSSTVIASQSAALSNRISQNTSFPTTLTTNTWIYSGKPREKHKRGLTSTIALILLIRILRKCANKSIGNRACLTNLRLYLTNRWFPMRRPLICSSGCLWCNVLDTWWVLRSSNSKKMMCKNWANMRKQPWRRFDYCTGGIRWATCTRAALPQGSRSAIFKSWLRKAISDKRIRLYHSLHDYCPLYSLSIYQQNAHRG